jgi:SAM-dependent methyltransferase
LRPGAQDVSIVADVIARWSRDHGTPPRALICGVTPELYRLPWPAGARVRAIDRARPMIDAVWPGPRGDVVCADWTAMPLANGSADVVLCDGGVHLVPFGAPRDAFARELARVVAPRGLFVARLFVPPARRESSDAVLRDLLDAKIASLNVLKLRLGMALQTSVAEGVQLSRVWDALHAVAPDHGQFAARLGWTVDHLRAIDTYRDCPARYHFQSVDDVRDLLFEGTGGRFALASVSVPTYDLGDRCPTVVFRRV